MAGKGNNIPFKSPQTGQPGWAGGDLFFNLSDVVQKCEQASAPSSISPCESVGGPQPFHFFSFFSGAEES